MNYSCSQCNFTSQFESALMMHKQLHHETCDYPGPGNITRLVEKTNTVPQISLASYRDTKEKKSFPLLGRTSSATKLFANLKARITRTKSRQLFPHPEEPSTVNVNDLSATSECTSKGLQGFHLDAASKTTTTLDSPSPPPHAETYLCHLCSFETDRITVLDRHLLNDHKIGLDNLLKLVLAKTKNSLSEDQTPELYGIRQPYYRPEDERIEEGEFVIETVTPKIKILKHAATNTDLQWTDIPDLKDNCRIITKELEKLMKYPLEMTDKTAFLNKMEILNTCMCKFVDSSNTLKRVLRKEYDAKRQDHESIFDLELGDPVSYQGEDSDSWRRETPAALRGEVKNSFTPPKYSPQLGTGTQREHEPEPTQTHRQTGKQEPTPHRQPYKPFDRGFACTTVGFHFLGKMCTCSEKAKMSSESFYF